MDKRHNDNGRRSFLGALAATIAPIGLASTEARADAPTRVTEFGLSDRARDMCLVQFWIEISKAGPERDMELCKAFHKRYSVKLGRALQRVSAGMSGGFGRQPDGTWQVSPHPYDEHGMLRPGWSDDELIGIGYTIESRSYIELLIAQQG